MGWEGVGEGGLVQDGGGASWDVGVLRHVIIVAAHI